MATWWIRQQILRSIADTCRTIRVPVHAHELLQNIHREVNAFERATGRSSSVAELADRLAIPRHKVEALLAVSAAPVPLDELDPDDFVDGDVASDPFERVAAHHLRRALDSLLADLKPKEERVIRLRFGFGVADALTLEEIGARYDVTRERIRQIEAKGIKRLKHPVRSDPLHIWLYGAPFKKTDSAVEDNGDDAPEDDEPTVPAPAPTVRANGAAALARAVKPNDEARAEAKPTVLDRLLAQAMDLGFRVEDQRGNGSGSIWVNLPDPPDSGTQALVRKLLEMGFEHWPGKGYWK